MTTIQAYGTLTDSIGSGLVDFDGDTFKLMLLTSSYTPAINTHQFADDLSGEVSGTGYTAGGATIGTTTGTYSAGVLTLDGADVSWDPVSLTGIRYAAVVDTTPGTAATNPLIALVDFEADQSTGTGGNFSVSWHANGIVTVEANPA